MKLKFRADAEDLMIFGMFALFLLYIVSIGVVNLHTFASEGHLSGLNPFPAFGPDLFFATIVFYIVILVSRSTYTKRYSVSGRANEKLVTLVAFG